MDDRYLFLAPTDKSGNTPGQNKPGNQQRDNTKNAPGTKPNEAGKADYEQDTAKNANRQPGQGGTAGSMPGGKRNDSDNQGGRR